jgi:DNA-binding HxlR family transcriptional regulator
MKVDISGLSKFFENRVRLGIMSILIVNDSYDFNSLKAALGVTDGNLASHIRSLEESGLVRVNKKFIGKKPNTSYSATETGEKLFRTHLKALEQLIRKQ